MPSQDDAKLRRKLEKKRRKLTKRQRKIEKKLAVLERRLADLARPGKADRDDEDADDAALKRAAKSSRPSRGKAALKEKATRAAKQNVRKAGARKRTAAEETPSAPSFDVETWNPDVDGAGANN